MLKMEEKMRILAWKEEGVSSEEIAIAWWQGSELPQARHASSQKGLWTSQKDEFNHEDDLEATGAKVSRDEGCRTTDKGHGIAGGVRADHPADPADRPENA
jgi:hypothetical protein